jgi:hypothetical protein
MVEFLSLLVAVLGAGILVFGVMLFVANRVQRRRVANVVGPYLVRIGTRHGKGRDGDDLVDQFETLVDARLAAQAALLASELDEIAGFVLGARADGHWDVIDRVDVLTK